MTALSPALQAFFTDRLITQRNSSPRTIAAYRDTLKLLLRFAHARTGKQPFELDIDDLDAPLIGAFLTHLEDDRGNSVRTRNARLGAIHSFYRYAALEWPEHAHTIARVMAIPTKRHERGIVCYLDQNEITALLAAPDHAIWLGRRDRALLALMIQTGVRVSELVGLRVHDAQLGTGRHIQVLGKGRKKRATPLTAEVTALLSPWITERGGGPGDPLFPTRQGRPLSRHTVGLLVGKHAETAATHCPSLNTKQVTPHTLRHTAAMLWRAKGVDIATIALLLGHESIQTTHIYEHADPALKEEAIARTAPRGVKPGRYRPSDKLLAFLGRTLIMLSSHPTKPCHATRNPTRWERTQHNQRLWTYNRLCEDQHNRFGEQPGETDREQSRHRAPGRLNRWAWRWASLKPSAIQGRDGRRIDFGGGPG